MFMTVNLILNLSPDNLSNRPKRLLPMDPAADVFQRMQIASVIQVRLQAVRSDRRRRMPISGWKNMSESSVSGPDQLAKQREFYHSGPGNSIENRPSDP